MIFAIIIFATAITIMAYVWYNISNQLSLSYGFGPELINFETQAFSQSILTPGYPYNWQAIINPSNISTWKNINIGIGNGSGLSLSKIYAFQSMANKNYRATKPLLGLAFDYYIMIYNNNINITIGMNPSNSKPLSINVVTVASSINGQPVTVKILVWSSLPFGVS